MKHTTGPWIDAGAVGHARYIRGGPGAEVSIAATHSGSTTEGVANAALIAAAPDLLAACKEAKKYLEPDLIEPGRTVFWHLVAAIAKAEVRNA